MSTSRLNGRIYFRDPQTFLVKDLVVNILDFDSHTVSTTTVQFCRFIAKAAIDNIKMNGRGCVPINFTYKQAVGLKLTHGPWFANPRSRKSP